MKTEKKAPTIERIFCREDYRGKGGFNGLSQEIANRNRNSPKRCANSEVLIRGTDKVLLKAFSSYNNSYGQQKTDQE